MIITIRNISQLIKYQEKISNLKYMEAVEANYSHEQMNPLNCILSSSKIVYKRLQQLIYEQNSNEENTQSINKDTLKICNSICHQG